MKHFLYQSILFFLFSLHIYGNEKVDSLFQVSAKQIGREKLETLRQAALIRNAGNTFKTRIEALLQAAQQQNDNLYIAAAFKEEANYYTYYNISQPNLAQKFIDKGVEALEKEDEKMFGKVSDRAIYNEIMISLNHLQVIQYIRDRNFVFALKRVLDFDEKTKYEENQAFKRFTYYQLGLIHTAMGNAKEAIDNYTRSLNYSSLDNPDGDLLVTIFSYYGIIDAYASLKDYDTGIAWCDIIMKNYESKGRLYDIANTSVFSEGEQLSKGKQLKRINIPFMINRYYAYSYISKNEMEKAKLYVDKCETDYPYLQESNVLLYYDLNAFYYWKLKKYNLAYQYINKVTEKIGSNVRTSTELTPFLMQADILNEWGKKEEAYNVLKKIYDLNNSINKNDTQSQITAIELMQKVESLSTELKSREAKVFRFRVIMIISVLSILFILIILFFIWRSNKKLRERNKELYKGHKRTQEIYKEIDNLRLENNLLKNKTDPYQVIIHKLDTYMEKEQAYLEPNITRDQIASELGTNRQYLVEAIREKKNQTVNEYLYSLRLQHIYNQIVSNQGLTISEIFNHSGFTSRSYFNSEFKREFGMTPSELQTIANEEAYT